MSTACTGMFQINKSVRDIQYIKYKKAHRRNQINSVTNTSHNTSD
jgi:hypothetical protein